MGRELGGDPFESHRGIKGLRGDFPKFFLVHAHVLGREQCLPVQEELASQP